MANAFYARLGAKPARSEQGNEEMKDNSIPLHRQKARGVSEWMATFRLCGCGYGVLEEHSVHRAAVSSMRKPAGHLELDGKVWAVFLLPVDENTEEDLTSLLTARELQVACLVAKGCPNKQIAYRLHISEWTVATYLRRIFAKLNVESRAAMAYRCANLIDSQDNVHPPCFPYGSPLRKGKGN